MILRTGFRLAAAAVSLLLAAMLAAPVSAGSFGIVVPIAGQASDIALDGPRGLLYIANFTASRIQVMSLASNTIQSAYNVPPQPGSLALSPDGNYLVITHFANFVAPGVPGNAVSVVSLNANNAIQTYPLTDPPLGVAFGQDTQALVVTTKQFLLLDPASGQMTVLDTVANVTANTLPAPPPDFPPQIIAASLNVSGDGQHVFGVTDTIIFHYTPAGHTVASIGYSSTPALGPRTVSVNRDGSFFMAGWSLLTSQAIWWSQFPNAAGTLNIGSSAIDSSAGLIYAQIPEGTAQSTAAPPTNPTTPPAPQALPVAPPILQIVDADNLTIRQKIQLPENLAGKSLLNAKGDILYSVSDSGVMVLPVGHLNTAHRLQAGQEDLVFRGTLCATTMSSQQLRISDPGGNHTSFSLTPSIPGITVSPASATTPAVVQVSVDPSVYQNQTGTITAYINIQGPSAVNVVPPVRVLINNHGPEDQGSFVNVPGTLVDVVADPARNRFYVLRQDQNKVLVFGSSGKQIAQLRTNNVPTSLAITWDQKHLLIGHDDSQVAYMYDLDTLQPEAPVIMPSGHYPRSIAASRNAILVASRVAGTTHTIDQVDMASHTASMLPTLGVFQNKINVDTALASSPDGWRILAAGADGTVMSYDAGVNTFVAARKDFSQLSGAFAASSLGQYIVDNNLLDSSLVVTRTLDSAAGSSSGFAFVNQMGYRTTAPATQSTAGVIEKVRAASGDGIRPTYIVEAPLLAKGLSAFTRTLAPLSDRSAIVSLTTSGFTLLPWNYDAAVAPPQLNSVVSAADLTKPIAPGGLIAVLGTQLSPSSQSTTDPPLPTSLGNSCLMVDGTPIPMLSVSPSQITAQLPFEAATGSTMVLRTAGGVSQALSLTVQPNAPSVFRDGVAGPQTGIATIVRLKNKQLVTLSNPIHSSDEIIIYLTGMGTVTPPVEDGEGAPSNPPSSADAIPTASLGGAGLSVEWAGLVPGQVGVYQINAKVPIKLPTGLSVPLVITQGGGSTTVPVRVVK